MPDIINLNLSELVLNIKDKKISSNEVTKAYIERSEKSKNLNSYNEETFNQALKRSKEFDSKPDFNKMLPGVPIAVKDLFCTKNVKTTASSKILNNFVPTYESTVTQNLWNEGAILLGKLNCDEFAMGSSNETSYFGNVISPIDQNLVPGGSSGGSASACARSRSRARSLTWPRRRHRCWRLPRRRLSRLQLPLPGRSPLRRRLRPRRGPISGPGAMGGVCRSHRGAMSRRPYNSLPLLNIAREMRDCRCIHSCLRATNAASVGDKEGDSTAGPMGLAWRRLLVCS